MNTEDPDLLLLSRNVGYARAAEIAQHAQLTGDLPGSVALLAPEWSEFIAEKASVHFASTPLARPLQ